MTNAPPSRLPRTHSESRTRDILDEPVIRSRFRAETHADNTGHDMTQRRRLASSHSSPQNRCGDDPREVTKGPLHVRQIAKNVA